MRVFPRLASVCWNQHKEMQKNPSVHPDPVDPPLPNGCSVLKFYNSCSPGHDWENAEAVLALFIELYETEPKFPFMDICPFACLCSSSGPLPKSSSSLYLFPGVAVKKYHNQAEHVPQLRRLEAWAYWVGRITSIWKLQERICFIFWPSF